MGNHSILCSHVNRDPHTETSFKSLGTVRLFLISYTDLIKKFSKNSNITFVNYYCAHSPFILIMIMMKENAIT